MLLDHYLDGAIEAEADAICDGENVYIIGIMEHIEPCGIHSGDSNATLPPFNLGDLVMQQIKDHTKKIALALNTVGLINIQFAVKNDKVYIIEANPRASRTVPFIAKAYGEPYVNYATKVMLGDKKVTDFDFKPHLDGYAIKQPVFSFNKFPNVNKQLGPEMKSTGEVMGIDEDFNMAYLKSQIGSGHKLYDLKNIFVSVKDEDKEDIFEIVNSLSKSGYNIYTTRGTHEFLTKKGISTNLVNKVAEGSPHVVEFIKDGKIDMVINTTENKQAIKDSFTIRRTAVDLNVPYFTNLRSAKILYKSLISLKNSEIPVKAIQNHHIY